MLGFHQDLQPLVYVGKVLEVGKKAMLSIATSLEKIKNINHSIEYIFKFKLKIPKNIFKI